MTNSTYRLRSGLSSEYVNGTAYSPTSYVHVDWYWLVLPTALILLSLPFLVATMVQSSRANTKPWKTSTLATLQGLGDELRRELGTLDSEARMAKRAETRSVRLEENKDGWRLVNRGETN